MESLKKKIKYEYPYLPEGRTISYVLETDRYMSLAKEYAEKYRSNLIQPGAAVVVRDGEVIGIGSIGNNPAHKLGCVRVELNMPTGEGYELCDGCNPMFHSEASAVRDMQTKNENGTNADLYLWGHWWCCKDCWDSMISAGIRDVYLLDGSEILFNKKDPGNIIGHQFDKKNSTGILEQ